MARKVVRIEFREAHRRFKWLRNSERRNVIAAYRFGEIMEFLHKGGFTWGEIADDFDRAPSFPALYARFFRAFGSEQEACEESDRLHTTNIAKLCGHTPLTPVVYVFICTNCGSRGDAIQKKKKQDEDQEPVMISGVPTTQFVSPHFHTGTEN